VTGRGALAVVRKNRKGVCLVQKARRWTEDGWLWEVSDGFNESYCLETHNSNQLSVTNYLLFFNNYRIDKCRGSQWHGITLFSFLAQRYILATPTSRFRTFALPRASHPHTSKHFNIEESRNNMENIDDDILPPVQQLGSNFRK
jgi:Na+-transporting NADH:ubiquinone oxidoreductase subunit NqrB